jgi:ADP-heptose:LPS heptosyltransferase
MKKLSFWEQLFGIISDRQCNYKKKYLIILGVKILLYKRLLNIQLQSGASAIQVENINNPQKNVLVIKCDCIGDYLLARNFWSEIKQSEKFKNAKLTLILSEHVREIATKLDSNVVDKFLFAPHFFWMNGISFDSVIDYLRQQGLEAYYDAVIILTSCIDIKFYAKVMDAMIAREVILEANDVPETDLPFYATSIVCNHCVLPGIDWEFNRHKYFFEKILQTKIKLERPIIEPNLIPVPKIELPKEFIVINPGAQWYYRVWDLRNYAALAEYIDAQYHLSIIILTSNKDKLLGDKIQEYTSVKLEHISGLEVLDAAAVVKNAALFIGNDSGFTHLAMAMNVKTIGLANDMFMTIRFLWYPENPNYKIIMPNGACEIGKRLMSSKPTDVKIADYQSKFNDYFNNVNMNSKYDVFAAVDKLLGLENKENNRLNVLEQEAAYKQV